MEDIVLTIIVFIVLCVIASLVDKIKKKRKSRYRDLTIKVYPELLANKKVFKRYLRYNKKEYRS